MEALQIDVKLTLSCIMLKNIILKDLRCSHRKIFKVCLTIFQHYAYSSSCNLAPPISRVLSDRHLIFCSLTSPMCCNLPWKYTPVRRRGKLSFQLSHRQSVCMKELIIANSDFGNSLSWLETKWVSLFFFLAFFVGISNAFA